MHPAADHADLETLTIRNATITVTGVAAIPVEVLMCVCWFSMHVSDQMSLHIYGHFGVKE